LTIRLITSDKVHGSRWRWIFRDSFTHFQFRHFERSEQLRDVSRLREDPDKVVTSIRVSRRWWWDWFCNIVYCISREARLIVKISGVAWSKVDFPVSKKNADHFSAIGKYVIIFLIFSLHVCVMINWLLSVCWCNECQQMNEAGWHAFSIRDGEKIVRYMI
jgi:hypothetical protein